MTPVEIFLLVLGLVFALPYALWRLGRTDHWAPLVVVQIVTGIALGPGVLGAAWPTLHAQLFGPEVITALNGIAWWAVMVFVWLAGIELDLHQAWAQRRESSITAGLALALPMGLGCAVAALLLMLPGWAGPAAMPWQFVAGVGMACAVTALPILILFMEKLAILDQPLGQRILRYASLDDLAIWAVLALILLDWTRVGRQLAFLAAFALLAWMFRQLMLRVGESDRWYLGLIWLLACALGADWAGLHFMVGAFLAGVSMDSHWFDKDRLRQMRHHVLLLLMPVFFLSTGLRTEWALGGSTSGGSASGAWAVVAAASLLLAASVAGKLAGVHLAGRILGWPKGEASLIGWLLQTKALIMIIFANVLLDKQLISSTTFTALLLMAVGSTMLTVPVVGRLLGRVG